MSSFKYFLQIVMQLVWLFVTINRWSWFEEITNNKEYMAKNGCHHNTCFIRSNNRNCSLLQKYVKFYTIFTYNYLYTKISRLQLG